MPKPTRSDVHVDRPLTNVAVAYMQKAEAFVADKVFPFVPVQKRSDKYWVYKRDDWFRSDAQERAPGTESAGGGYELETDDYVCKRQSLHKDVDDETRANSDQPINVDRDATNYVTRQLMLKREKLWAANYFDTGVWTTDVTGGVDFTEWATAGSDPVGDIGAQQDAVEELTGYRPNILVVGPAVHRVLKNHADVLDRIKYTQRGMASNELLASLFEVEKYLVARVTENTAKEGQDKSMSYLFGKQALLCYAPPSPGLMEPSAGYTFGWTGLLGAGATGMRMKRFRIERLESDRIEGDIYFDQKVVAADLGVFFDAAVA